MATPNRIGVGWQLQERPECILTPINFVPFLIFCSISFVSDFGDFYILITKIGMYK